MVIRTEGWDGRGRVLAFSGEVGARGAATRTAMHRTDPYPPQKKIIPLKMPIMFKLRNPALSDFVSKKMILRCLLRAILGGGAVGKGEEQKVLLSSLGFTNTCQAHCNHVF